MESLKADFFDAICEIVRTKGCVGQFGIGPELREAIVWYNNAPDDFSDLVYKALRRKVLDVRGHF